jgi:hypothetical protein
VPVREENASRQKSHSLRSDKIGTEALDNGVAPGHTAGATIFSSRRGARATAHRRDVDVTPGRLARTARAGFNCAEVFMTKMLRAQFLPGPRSAVLAIALAALAASPARADRCDDLAGQLKSQIDGLKIGQTAAGVIYLAHPNAREITLGCSSRNYSNQLFAKSDRKPPATFLDLMAGASAIVFTLPKDDMLKGVTRCVKRMGLFRGDDISIRYRRLDLHCVRTKTEATVTISRGKDQ